MLAQVEGQAHVVEFYEQEDRLVESITGLASRALRSGEAVVLLATAEHIDAFNESLAAIGIDVPAEVRAGNLWFEDAHGVIERLMVMGMPYPPAFRAMLEDLIRKSPRPRLRAFGETVNILWGRGERAAALELEALWSEALKDGRITLVCAYLLSGFAEAEDIAAFRQVCVHHTHVRPVQQCDDIEDAGHLRVIAELEQHRRALEHEVEHRKLLIADLERARTDLRDANEGLERLVAERTMALEDAQRALMRKERLAVLGRLVGGLAHQIRNPLCAIANATTILQKELGARASGVAMQSTEVISEEVWRANRIITDLIDFARIRPAEPRPVAVADLVQASIRARDVPPGVTVTVDVPSTLQVLVDQDQVEGALANLTANALEAMGEAGVLSFRSHQTDDQVVVEVDDTGPGIEPAVWEHLFEPLVTSKPMGLGLGLTTCRSLIHNQGGSIHCSTEQGKGTRFEVRLPAAP